MIRLREYQATMQGDVLELDNRNTAQVDALKSKVEALESTIEAQDAQIQTMKTAASAQDAQIQTMKTTARHIEQGHKNCDISGTGNKYHTVTFATPYAKPPKVFLSLRDIYSTKTSVNHYMAADRVTTTSFRLRCIVKYGHMQYMMVYWISFPTF